MSIDELERMRRIGSTDRGDELRIRCGDPLRKTGSTDY
jgi:hypothetical protein